MKRTNKLILLLMTFCISLCLFGCDDSNELTTNPERYLFEQDDNTVTLPFDINTLSEMDCTTAANELKSLGFTNVSSNAVPSQSQHITDGTISHITIDGESDFSAYTSFPTNAQVVITYYESVSPTSSYKKPDTKDSDAKQEDTYNDSTDAYESENVYIPQSGKKYHNNPNCSNMKNPSEVTLQQAKSSGYTPCKRCYK